MKDDSLFAGFGAGALAALIVTPMDVVKTRLQTLNDPSIKMSTIYREIYREEGIRAFFLKEVCRDVLLLHHFLELVLKFTS